ncbi:MAG: C4-dicarboxylate ABC transporter [Alphaproteobacteria bacterium HGW-Alphaproteobacteria-6]|nr:MAG: C4-dicarboxylate ABC transporter [Alphaproteobacteria bacterium HGW-Alphaproteobacteria-6]
MIRRAVVLAAFLLAVAAVTGTVWRIGLARALDRLEARGQADLALAASRLNGELQRYREMAVLIAGHAAVRAAIDAGGVAGAAPDEGAAGAPAADAAGALVALLQRAADVTGSRAVMLAARDGRVIAGSVGAAGDGDGDGGVGLAEAPHFRRALQGALGFAPEVAAGGVAGEETADDGAADDRTATDGATAGPAAAGRAFVYAAPVFGADGGVGGALIVRITAARVEAGWRGAPMAVYFTDRTGLVFVANRDEIVLTRQRAGPGAGTGAGPDAGAGAGTVGRVMSHGLARLAGHAVWRIDGGPYLPAEALHLARPMPVVGMTAEALVDTAPARRAASQQALVAVALSLGLGAVLFGLGERRRALSRRLADEAAANARLETRVAERTAELLAANDRLQRAQKDLVQAGKLSALGQMSAGISHELNQPLMAIRTYAENAGLLLDRGQGDQTAANLARISDLARRMGRIIKNLRAFARQESGAVGDVDLVGVVEAALELSEARLRGAGVRVAWQPPGGPVLVRGGEVRLQQVLINLIANAGDAMAGQPAPAARDLAIAITAPAPGRVRLTVADSGPGIADPERIFDPFYTTKEVGQGGERGEGMGLGLSISYGIVQSFGGAILGRNLPGGGAEFAVDLDAAAAGTAAGGAAGGAKGGRAA